MKYYMAKSVSMPFEAALTKTREALAAEGFGVLTEIDVRETLKKKINADIMPYRILGACNPAAAHQALQADDRIGVMLPCNVIVHERAEGGVEIAAVDPLEAMSHVGNADLAGIAATVRAKLAAALERI